MWNENSQLLTWWLLVNIRMFRAVTCIVVLVQPSWYDYITKKSHLSLQKFVAYSGNNMRKASPSPDPKDKNKEVHHHSFTLVYFSFSVNSRHLIMMMIFKIINTSYQLSSWSILWVMAQVFFPFGFMAQSWSTWAWFQVEKTRFHNLLCKLRRWGL